MRIEFSMVPDCIRYNSDVTGAQHSTTLKFQKYTEFYTFIFSSTKIEILKSTQILSTMIAGDYLVFLRYVDKLEYD